MSELDSAKRLADPRRDIARVVRWSILFFLWIVLPAAAHSSELAAPPPLNIARAAAPIVVDGVLDDIGWEGAQPITTWFETSVGDNVEPAVENVAYLAFDARFLYAGFRFADPDPQAIRAPLGDHDALPSSTDFAGLYVDSRNDGKTAQVFFANPRGVQYDAMYSDASGEDSSPDFLWDVAGKIDSTGWSLEIRIPFSTLRYSNEADPTWRILLHRNLPRDRQYQFYSARLPRDVNCFICNAAEVVGLSDLPRGSHLVVAPFATAQRTRLPRAGLGSPLGSGDSEIDGGLDLKWSPSTSMAVDLTVNPDFSQVESDAAQITANERSALFFSEKRPFFLEGVDLLSTPIPVVYTRTITSPRGGLRATGRLGSTAFTALVTQDRGGGLVILPGPQGSEFALQDFRSDVGVVRLRRDLGSSFVSVLATGRHIEDGGSNLLAGPDVLWRPSASDALTGQLLWSRSRTPDRPSLSSRWDGRQLSDHALMLGWSHATERVDWDLQALDVGLDFRADNGFVPQVGYREGYLDAGYTMRPSRGFLSRLRLFTVDYYDIEVEGSERPLNQHLSVGADMEGRFSSVIRVELNHESVRVGDAWLRRLRPRVLLEASPGWVVNQVSLDTRFGEEIDFANGRDGNGVNVVASATVRPSAHLELVANADLRTLDVDAGPGLSGRVFTAKVARLRATWSFSSRAFLRLIGQYVETRNDPALYTFPVEPKEAEFAASALVAYKLNWQTVCYAGYGDVQTHAEPRDELVPSRRELFAKVSYAWQK